MLKLICDPIYVVPTLCSQSNICLPPELSDIGAISERCAPAMGANDLFRSEDEF